MCLGFEAQGSGFFVGGSQSQYTCGNEGSTLNTTYHARPKLGTPEANMTPSTAPAALLIGFWGSGLRAISPWKRSASSVLYSLPKHYTQLRPTVNPKNVHMVSKVKW